MLLRGQLDARLGMRGVQAGRAMLNVPTEQERVLLIVDPQVDFVTGSLAVPKAQAAIDVCAKLAPHYPLVVVSRDWHPRDHCSFTTNGGIWPEHCVQYSSGAWEADRIFESYPQVLKGTKSYQEAYSAFDGRLADGEMLSGFLAGNCKHLGIRTVEVVGLALDFCVKATALDAKKIGYDTYVNLYGTAGVSPATSHAALAEMDTAGVKASTARLPYGMYVRALNEGRVPALR